MRNEALRSLRSLPTVNSVIEGLKLSRIHINILVAAALGNAFDAFDTYIVSYAMPSIVKEWNIDPVTNGFLTSTGIWGMFFRRADLGTIFR